MTSVIELDQVSKTYKMDEVEVKALRGVDLKVKKNEFIAITGPSGSGKSTMLHMIGCLDRPSTGKIFLEEADVSKLNESQLARVRGKKIGFVFQYFNLYPTLTAQGNVELPMMIIEEDKKAREKRALELLNRVGLKERAKHFPSQLSGGERQRVAIARALANEPAFILADEPTGNLDSQSGSEIMKIFVELNKEGKTLIIVTHDSTIASHCKRVVMMRDGQIIQEKRRNN